ncbi:Uncharacterised protein [Vibrio cholerae]|nr:Uncharacterised protein [Vibrio cholerae]CSI62198.1 Uncharacterised protein [Vibrio cholerae]
MKQYLVIHPVSFSFELNRFSTKGKKIQQNLEYSRSCCWILDTI